MAHRARLEWRANWNRRKAAREKQKPLPMAEQLRRRDANAKAHANRYPVPPVYANGYERSARTQPACYTFGPDSVMALVAGMMMNRRRQRAA